MNIKSLIDELDKLVDEAKNVPLTGRCILDKSVVIEILNDMRLRLPEEIKEANKIMNKHDEIIGSAKREAEDIIKDAEAKMYKMLDESEITVKAEKMAEQICEKAEQYDRDTRNAAVKYADSVLADLQNDVNQVINAVNTAYNETVNAFQSSLDNSLKPVDGHLSELKDVVGANRKSLQEDYLQ